MTQRNFNYRISLYFNKNTYKLLLRLLDDTDIGILGKIISYLFWAFCIPTSATESNNHHLRKGIWKAMLYSKYMYLLEVLYQSDFGDSPSPRKPFLNTRFGRNSGFYLLFPLWLPTLPPSFSMERSLVDCSYKAHPFSKCNVFIYGILFILWWIYNSITAKQFVPYLLDVHGLYLYVRVDFMYLMSFVGFLWKFFICEDTWHFFKCLFCYGNVCFCFIVASAVLG